MILFFDTETTGKLDFGAPPESPAQPNLVQLAAMLMDDAAERVFGQINLIIQPDGWRIPPEAAAIHGIDQALAETAGQPIRTALSAFNHLCRPAESLIAHNIDFDYPVILTAYMRQNVPHRLAHLRRVCTMRAATPLVKLPKPPGKWKPRPGDEYKWPTLTECHRHFLGESFDGAHDAMNDVWAMVRVYRALISVGAMPGKMMSK